MSDGEPKDVPIRIPPGVQEAGFRMTQVAEQIQLLQERRAKESEYLENARSMLVEVGDTTGAIRKLRTGYMIDVDKKSAVSDLEGVIARMENQLAITDNQIKTLKENHALIESEVQKLIKPMPEDDEAQLEARRRGK